MWKTSTTFKYSQSAILVVSGIKAVRNPESGRSANLIELLFLSILSPGDDRNNNGRPDSGIKVVGGVTGGN